MTVKVLFTLEADEWKEGADHLVAGGLWVKQFVEDDKQKAHIYCLDKVTLAEFADGFGLTKFDRDIEMYGHGRYLKTFRITVWGSKLEQILEWRKAVQPDSESPEGL